MGWRQANTGRRGSGRSGIARSLKSKRKKKSEKDGVQGRGDRLDGLRHGYPNDNKQKMKSFETRVKYEVGGFFLWGGRVACA